MLRQKGLEDVQRMPWEMQKAVTALVKDRWWHDNKPDIDKEAVMEEVSHRGSAEAHEGRAPYRVHNLKGQNTQHMQSRFAQSHGNLQHHQHTQVQHNEHNSQQWRT